VILVDAYTGAINGSFVAHDGDVHVIMETMNGRRVWTASDTDIRVWEFDVGCEGFSLSQIATLTVHTGKVLCLLPIGNTMWSGSFDTSILVWDTQTLRPIQELVGEQNDAVKVLVPINNSIWSGASDGFVVQWI